MNKRFIDAEALIRSIVSDRRLMPDGLNGREIAEGIAYALHKITKAPAADVVERVRGEWIEDGYEGVIVCSYCGMTPLSHPESMNTYVLSRFCPNCGAKMDGGIYGKNQ